MQEKIIREHAGFEPTSLLEKFIVMAAQLYNTQLQTDEWNEVVGKSEDPSDPSSIVSYGVTTLCRDEFDIVFKRKWITWTNESNSKKWYPVPFSLFWCKVGMGATKVVT